LSEAVKETKNIVDDDQWIYSIRQASGEDSKEILAMTLTPVAK
jgi:hypothetical protein